MKAISKRNHQGIVELQQHWIKQLEAISIRPIWISRTWMDGITPGKRLPVRDYHWRRPYQYRECLHNEIPYDLDVWNWDLLKIIIQPLLDFLKSERIPHILSGSGGSKSLHVQIWFKPMFECVHYSWSRVRYELWNWILDQANIPEDMRGGGMRFDGMNYAYDSSVCNFSDMSHGKVMRDFGGHALGKGTKTVILGALPEKRKEIYQRMVVMPMYVQLWDASKVMDELEMFESEPKSCYDCPIALEWCLAKEPVDDDAWEIPQYPSLCRECGKVYVI